MKPTMYEFLQAYYKNIYEGLAAGNIDLRHVQLSCDFCPFHEACSNSFVYEGDNDTPCDLFITSQLADGGWRRVE